MWARPFVALGREERSRWSPIRSAVVYLVVAFASMPVVSHAAEFSSSLGGYTIRTGRGEGSRAPL